MFKLIGLCLIFIALASSHLRGWRKHKKNADRIEAKLDHMQKGIDFIIEELTQIEEVVTGGLEFTENGVTLTQDHSYNDKTKEAVIKIPAHGDYGNNTVIMVGRTSNSKLAGKMMSATDKACEFHELPPFVNPEDLAKAAPVADASSADRAAGEEQIVYVHKTDLVEVTVDSEEYKSFSDAMKEACASKPIYMPVVEFLNEIGEPITATKNGKKKEEFDVTFVPMTETSTQDNTRDTCIGITAACQPKPTVDSCYRWWDIPANVTGQVTKFHMIGTTHLPTDQLCIKCCNQTNTPIIPCECVTNKQVFSSAYYQLYFECYSAVYPWNINAANFCKWDPTSEIIKTPIEQGGYGCDYTGIGACVDDPTTCHE